MSHAMDYRIITPPAMEPLSAEDAREYLRLGSEDPLEYDLIPAARMYCENRAGMALAPQTIEAYPSQNAAYYRFPLPPIISIVSVIVTDAAGNERTLTPGVDYCHDRRRIMFLREWWPKNPYPVYPCKIQYTAGETPVSPLISRALKLLISHWYNNRDMYVIGESVSPEIGTAVTAIINQYKQWWF